MKRPIIAVTFVLILLCLTLLALTDTTISASNTRIPDTHTRSLMAPLETTRAGGIISEDTTWTAENSPYEITETVQIPSGVTLTIEPGVMISRSSSGDMFVLMGTICAHGTSQEPIVIDGGGNSKIVYTQPGYGYGDFQYCIIQNGYDFWDRWGHLDLRYSELVNLGTGGNWSHSIIKLDGPLGESNIEFNRFISTGGIYSYNDQYGTNIGYNLFQGLLSPLAHMGGGTPGSPPKEMIVKYNSFIDTQGLALYLESGFIGWSPNIDATENYWGTLDTDIIDQMIWDRNDDITIDRYIGYLPILTEPHPDTPEIVSSPPSTPANPSPGNHATDVSIDTDLSWTGGDPDVGDTVTYDVYFGTSISPPLVSNDQIETSYDSEILTYDTKYYWKVVATDNHSASSSGPLWDFTTQVGIAPTVAWNCPVGAQVLIAPNPGKGRPYLGVAANCSEITVSADAELWGIYYLDEPTGNWLYFIPGFVSSTLTELEPDEFYLVLVSDACTLTIPQ